MKPVKSDVPYREIQAHFGKTAPLGTNTTQIATTAFVAAATGAASVPAPIITHLITTSSQALAADTTTAITGLTATITPSTTAKRVNITVRWNGEGGVDSHNAVFGITRDGTIIGGPAAAGLRNIGIAIVAQSFGGGLDAGSTPESVFYQYIDSPATTAAVVYNATIRVATAATLYNQFTVDDIDSNVRERLTSTIILEEIN